ncbi:MAG: flagellar biosynthetic protein FliO [Candidatus Goldiibacteriota bacterium]
MIGTTINLIVSLLFIIGLMYLVMLGIKFIYVKASIPLKTEGVVKVLAKENIDAKKAVYVIEFADRILLLGAGGEGLNVLAEIKDEETMEKVKSSADEYISRYRSKSRADFSKELKATYIKQGKKAVDSGNKTLKKVMDKLKKSDENENR